MGIAWYRTNSHRKDSGEPNSWARGPCEVDQGAGPSRTGCCECHSKATSKDTPEIHGDGLMLKSQPQRGPELGEMGKWALEKRVC